MEWCSHTFWFLQIKTPAQLEAAFAFLSITGSDDLKSKEFEDACGVGETKFTHLSHLNFIYCYVCGLITI